VPGRAAELRLNTSYAAALPVGRAELTALAEVPADWIHATAAAANWVPIWLFVVSAVGIASVGAWATSRAGRWMRGWHRILQDVAAGRTQDSGRILEDLRSSIAEVRELSSLAAAVNDAVAADRAAARAAATAAADQVQALLDHAVAGVTVKDRDGRYIMANLPFTVLHGLSPGAVIGATDLEVCGPDSASLIQEREAAAMGSGRPAEIDYAVTIGGVQRTMVRRVFPVPSPGSGLSVLGAITIDVTERRQHEQRMFENEERYRTVANYTHDWEYWLAPDGTLRYVSPACERITGYAPADFERNPDLLLFIVHPDDRHTISEHFAEGRLLGASAKYDVSHVELEFRIQTKAGETRWLSHVCRAVVSESGTYLGRRASNRDITARREADQERLQLVAQNLRLQKSESLARMAGGVAHLINNNLTVVMGNLDLIASASDPAELRELAGDARFAADRAAEIGRFLLTYLGQSGGERTSTDIAAMCRLVVDETRMRVPPNIEVSVALDVPGPRAVVDVAQVSSAVAHLLDNACDAIGRAGGALRISVGRVQGLALERGLYPAGWTPEDRPYVAIAVADSGEGILPENVERVFDPFFSTRFPGRGLGLTIVAAVARDHGGGVTLHTDASGTVMRLLLPAAPATG
jgi:PAS domain S-box-containing protein